MRIAVYAGLFGVVVSLGSPVAAWADSIDGSWCHLDGRRMRIEGPRIVTPAGTATQGNYGRHDFTYVVPQGDPGSGMTIRMLLMGETHVRVQEGDKTPVIWERCGPSIS
jgi:hypothetical protein